MVTRAIKDTTTLSFMKPPQILDFARGPGNGLNNPRVCGAPKAGRHYSALFLVWHSDAAGGLEVVYGHAAVVGAWAIVLRAAAHPSRRPGNLCKTCRGTFHLRTVLNAERKKLRPYRLYRGKKEESSRSRTNCYDNTSCGCRGPLTLGNQKAADNSYAIIASSGTGSSGLGFASSQPRTFNRRIVSAMSASFNGGRRRCFQFCTYCRTSSSDGWRPSSPRRLLAAKWTVAAISAPSVFILTTKSATAVI